MAYNFRACDRDQQFLIAPDMREWLPADHLVWFVLDSVEELELGGFYAAYRVDGQGARAHDPEMMVALLLYCYAVGETSTRRIERRLYEDVGFRVLAANQHPDHSTISRFRCRHQDALAGLFTQILTLCERAGLLVGGNLAIDGTKLAANASLSAGRTPVQIRAEVERYFEEAERVDAAEDELFGDRRGDELPLADRGARREALRRAKEELDREQQQRDRALAGRQRSYQEHIQRTGRRPTGRPPGPRKVTATGQRNLTDPDSRVVRDKGALIQGYNAQAAVCEGQLIVAAEITNDTNDQRQLEPMATAAVSEINRHAIKTKTTVLADTGYWNHAQIAKLRSAGNEVIIPTTSRTRKTPAKRGPKTGPEAERIDRLLATEHGRALYQRRQHIIEPVFGQIKHGRGLRRLSRRGLAACSAEWKLIAATHNLLKLRRATQTA